MKEDSLTTKVVVAKESIPYYGERNRNGHDQAKAKPNQDQDDFQIHGILVCLQLGVDPNALFQW